MAASNTSGSSATVQKLLQQMPGWKELASPGSHAVLSRIERCHTTVAQTAVAVLCSTFTIVAVTATARDAVITKKKSG